MDLELLVVKLGSVFLPNAVLNLNTALSKESKIGFIPQTVQNILWYNCESGKFVPANHVKFNEGMNDLPFKLLPPNQRDSERAEQGDKSSAKSEKVDIEDGL